MAAMEVDAVVEIGGRALVSSHYDTEVLYPGDDSHSINSTQSSSPNSSISHSPSPSLSSLDDTQVPAPKPCFFIEEVQLCKLKPLKKKRKRKQTRGKRKTAIKKVKNVKPTVNATTIIDNTNVLKARSTQLSPAPESRQRIHSVTFNHFIGRWKIFAICGDRSVTVFSCNETDYTFKSLLEFRPQSDIFRTAAWCYKATTSSKETDFITWYLLIGGKSGLLWAADLRGGKFRFAMQHSGEIMVLKAKHDKPKIILSGSEDRTLRLWNVITRSCLAQFIGHKDTVHGAEFHPSQTLIVSSSIDREFFIWDYSRLQLNENTTTPRSMPMLIRSLIRLDFPMKVNEVRWYGNYLLAISRKKITFWKTPDTTRARLTGTTIYHPLDTESIIESDEIHEIHINSARRNRTPALHGTLLGLAKPGGGNLLQSLGTADTIESFKINENGKSMRAFDYHQTSLVNVHNTGMVECFHAKKIRRLQRNC